MAVSRRRLARPRGTCVTPRPALINARLPKGGARARGGGRCVWMLPAGRPAEAADGAPLGSEVMVPFTGSASAAGDDPLGAGRPPPPAAATGRPGLTLAPPAAGCGTQVVPIYTPAGGTGHGLRHTGGTYLHTGRRHGHGLRLQRRQHV